MPEVRVEIDTRERVGSDPAAFSRVSHSVRKQLPFGDAFFYVDDTLQMVVERKTAVDFVASVLGRFDEQLRALIAFKKENEKIPVVIVIEGDLSQVDLRGVSPERFRTEIQNWTRVGITRMDTLDVNDTVDYYNSNVKAFEKMGSVANFQQAIVDTVPIMSAGKKSQVTAANFLSVTLANISGISSEAASVLSKHYSSLAEFVENYNANEAQTLMLGKRRLGAKRAARIEAFIHNRDEVKLSRPKKAKK